MEMFEPEWLLRILAAMCAGIVIGLERHTRAKEAGIRTHAMVAVGACLLMLISKYGFSDVSAGDPARIAAQVVSGIGFLGAGVIFVRHDVVQGLTTAAVIWATSAIGLAFGSGMYVIGAVTTVLMVIIQHVLLLFLPHHTTNTMLRLKIRMAHDDGIDEAMKIMDKHNFHSIGQNNFSSDGEGGWYLSCDALTHKEPRPEALIREMEASDKIISVEIL